MAEFFDKLRTDKKLEEALRLVETVADSRLKSRIQAVLIVNFSQVPALEPMLRSLLDTEQAPQPTDTEPSPIIFPRAQGVAKSSQVVIPPQPVGGDRR
jgi:hypothetical protein